MEQFAYLMNIDSSPMPVASVKGNAVVLMELQYVIVFRYSHPGNEIVAILFIVVKNKPYNLYKIM